MKRLLVVGWDAADWKIIDPLLARGEMPNLNGLLQRGVRGNLATLYPPLSPMLWTSIATGKRAWKHGIHGFVEPAEDGLSVRPISNLGRKAKAFWNILNQHGRRSIVVGWWPSHPAEPLRGATVSNLFVPTTADDPDGPMIPHSVWPPELASALADLRIHGAHITGDIIRMFVPDFQAIDQTNDKILHDLAGIIAEAMTVHAAATDLMERIEWDLAAIYYSSIDHFSHRFMRYHAGKAAAGTSSPELFRDVVRNAYRYHDVMLGRLLELAGPDCGVMLLSDHGFHSDSLLPDYLPAEATGPALEHRDFGIFCMAGEGVRRGESVYGSTILDIAPTVLHCFGMPAAHDMDGRILIHAFENQTMAPPIPSWEEVAGDDGRHPAWRQYDSGTSAQVLDQLVRLGYVAPPSEDARKNVAEVAAENQYNLARDLLDCGRFVQAGELLERLVADDPEQGRYYLHLFECRFQQGNYATAAEILDRFDREAERFAAVAAEELTRRRADLPDADLPRDAHGKPEHHEWYLRRQLAEKAMGFVTERLVARTRLMLAQAGTPEQIDQARRHLHQLEPAAEAHPALSLFLASAHATVKNYDRALDLTRGVLRANPDQWQAMALAARIHQANGRHRQAVEFAIDSLALVYFQPVLHYHMGLSFWHIGERARAEHSFRIALSQMPGLVAAQEELAKLLRNDPSRPAEAALETARAEKMRRAAEQQERPPATDEPVPPALLPDGLDRWSGAPPADRNAVITVVSGLPRSGTSMMMQMLRAAGIEPFTDRLRAPDAHNPRGYFEHELSMRLHEDNAWLSQARGKVVKIVAHLLPHLADGEQYRVVLVHRNLDEVVESQSVMLNESGPGSNGLNRNRLIQAYASQLVRAQEWLLRAPGIEVITVRYAEALADPLKTAARLARFLGEPFDIASAAAAVDPSLRHQSNNSAQNSPGY
jgi:predicted AlkP superfamily phosphohydrolase/phosphomutase/tetratricopeptide (TPR) repeat protein